MSMPEKTVSSSIEVAESEPRFTNFSRPQHVNDAPQKQLRKIRRVLSLGTISEALVGLTITIASLYFVVFAILVYIHRGEPFDTSYSKALLQAAQYASL